MVNQIDNIVPILAIENKCSLQQAVDDACNFVCEARRILEDAEKRVPMPTGNADLDRQIKQYIQGCKDVVSGVLLWSYASDHGSPFTFFPSDFYCSGSAIETKDTSENSQSEKETRFSLIFSCKCGLRRCHYPILG
jgi:hypothetical protein